MYTHLITEFKYTNNRWYDGSFVDWFGLCHYSNAVTKWLHPWYPSPPPPFCFPKLSDNGLDVAIRSSTTKDKYFYLPRKEKFSYKHVSLDVFKQGNFESNWMRGSAKKLVATQIELWGEGIKLPKLEIWSTFMTLSSKNIYLLSRLKFVSRYFKMKGLIC